MFHKSVLITISLLGILTLAILFLPNQVSHTFAAQAEEKSVGLTCVSCHEDLYHLHDTGKWYCITERKDDCANCHEGNVSVTNREEAHLGLIVHPQRNNGEKCLECHPQDVHARLEKFASLGGYKTIADIRPYVPSGAPTGGYPNTLDASSPVDNWPWAVGGIFAFGFWLALVLFSPTKP